MFAWSLCAFSQDLAFTHQYGGVGEDRPYGQVADQFGNVFITGIFAQSVQMGPNILTSNGDNDIFIAKFDSNGICTWSTSAGGPLHDRGVGINLDEEGNVYITGIFMDTAHFQNLQVVSAGNWDMFIAKYDTLGRCVWVSRGGGTNDDRGADLIVGKNGSIYLTGWFRFNAQFGAFPLTSNGHFDFYVAKYDQDGKCSWIKNYGGPGFDKCYSIDLFADSVLYLSGYFLEEADFDSIHIDAIGIRDAFLVKMDTAGNVIWVEQGGGAEYDRALDAKADQAGNIYLTGHFRGPAWFDDQTIISKGDWDVFTAKYDASGKCLWARRAGGSFIDKGESIQIDDLGHVYVSGIFEDTSDFQHYTFTSGYLRDAFVAKYDTAGTLLWASHGKSTQDVLHIGLSNPGPAGLYLAGDFMHQIVWEGDTLVHGLNMDINLNRIVNCVSAPPPILPNGEVEICPGDTLQLVTNGNFATYLWSSGDTGTSIQATTTGDYFILATNNQGCVSANQMKLQHFPSQTLVFPSTQINLCAGDSIQLSSNPALINTWNTGDTAISIFVADSGTFLSTTLDTFGCITHSDSIRVSLISLPTPIISLSDSTVLCTGDTQILVSNFVNGNVWSNGNNSAALTVMADTNLSLSVTDSFGCTGTSDSVAVVFNPPPFLEILASGSTDICPGDTLWLTAQTGQSVLWNTGEQTSTILVTDSGSFTVTATDSLGCNATEILVVSIRQPVSIPFPTSPYSTTLQNLGVINPENQDGKQIVAHQTTSSPFQQVEYVWEDVCPPSRKVALKMHSGNKSDQYNVVPNPVKSGVLLSVRSQTEIGSESRSWVQVIRPDGKVWRISIDGSKTHFEIATMDWEAGMYFLEFPNNTVEKLIVTD